MFHSNIFLLFLVGLIIICTYQAFLVRKVPTNYNEAKFIALTMITICISVIVYVPIHFGSPVYSRNIIACFLFEFIGIVELVCLFGPKLYIVLLRPDKNIIMQRSVCSPSQSKTRYPKENESETNLLKLMLAKKERKLQTLNDKAMYSPDLRSTDINQAEEIDICRGMLS